MANVVTALFHKLEIDGKVYYQCRFIVPVFDPNDRFDSLLNREKSNKHDFYVTASLDKLRERGIQEKAIFVENGGLKLVNDQKLLTYVKTKFDDENQVLAATDKERAEKEAANSHPSELIEAYVKKIEDETKCQKRAIREIVGTIVYNRELNKSRLSTLTKNMHHDNIVLFGPVGSGEDIILDSISKNLQIPVIRLKLTGDTEMDTEVLANSICESKKEFKGNALVILDCDYKVFAEEFEGDIFYPLRELITYQGTYTSPYLETPIKFNELTYLTSINVPPDTLNIKNIEPYFTKLTSCTKAIRLDKLSMTQIRNVLYRSDYSVLKYCEETAKKFNREFSVNKKAVADAIKFIDFFGGHMVMLNSAILESFKGQLEHGIGKITIDREILEFLGDVIDIENPALDNAPDNFLFDDKEKEEEENEEDIDQVDKITNEILKTVRGQDKQVRRIVKTILKNLSYAKDPNVVSPEKHKKNILIRGDSGTGKTEIVRQLAKIIGVPIFIADATQYTEEGYVGDSVNEMLLDLYHEAGDDIEKAETGILVIDEIDKKANTGERSDVSRLAVLQSLLKIVEGTKKRIKYERILPNGAPVKDKLDFDTRRLTVVVLGAFENLEKFRDERIKKATKPKGMGFMSSADVAAAEKEQNAVNRNFINEDYSAYGMGNQFIPRFQNKVYLNQLSKEDLVDIMKNSITSATRLKKEDYLRDGILLEFTDDFYEKLAEVAHSKKAGARGIDEALEDVIEFLGLNDINTRLYQKIIINADCITNQDALVLVPREHQKTFVKK